MSEAGRAAYEAYCGAREWKSHDGRPLPPWEDQDESLRAAWDVAADAALNAAADAFEAIPTDLRAAYGAANSISER